MARPPAKKTFKDKISTSAVGLSLNQAGQGAMGEEEPLQEPKKRRESPF